MVNNSNLNVGQNFYFQYSRAKIIFLSDQKVRKQKFGLFGPHYAHGPYAVRACLKAIKIVNSVCDVIKGCPLYLSPFLRRYCEWKVRGRWQNFGSTTISSSPWRPRSTRASPSSRPSSSSSRWTTSSRWMSQQFVGWWVRTEMTDSIPMNCFP